MKRIIIISSLFLLGFGGLYAKAVDEIIVGSVKSDYRDSVGITNIVGTSADKDTWIYQINESGMYIREVDYDMGSGQGKKIEIVQLTDLHFSHFNQEDESNPTLMYTKQECSIPPEIFIPSTQKAMQYACLFDQTIITGDVLNYLSSGAMELAKKYIWDVDPKVIIAPGNHEYVQRCRGPIPETYTLAQRTKMLEDYWKPYHDMHYYSRLIGGKVLCVMLDNGQVTYLDGQSAKLSADIQLARNNGWIILIFQHFPISTGNPDDTNVYTISGDSPCNYYDGRRDLLVFPSTSASKEVYELITGNADVIKGVFCGHVHDDFSLKINATYTDGAGTHAATIPMYVLAANINNSGGHALKITIRY